MKKFKADVKNECRHMYVFDGKSALEISKHFAGTPTHQTISNWIKRGQWDEERRMHENDMFEKASPKGLAQKILDKINTILSLDNASFTTKDADSLAKLQAALRNITDKRYQIPMMYQLLTDFMNFLARRYPDLLTDDLMSAVRAFKEEIKESLE